MREPSFGRWLRCERPRDGNGGNSFFSPVLPFDFVVDDPTRSPPGLIFFPISFRAAPSLRPRLPRLCLRSSSALWFAGSRWRFGARGRGTWRPPHAHGARRVSRVMVQARFMMPRRRGGPPRESRWRFRVVPRFRHTQAHDHEGVAVPMQVLTDFRFACRPSTFFSGRPLRPQQLRDAIWCAPPARSPRQVVASRALRALGSSHHFAFPLLSDVSHAASSSS